MITEDYVSFEVAKLLKENGFNEKCEYCYAYFDDNDIRVFELRPNKNAQDLAENRYPYVTHQMAMKWLREVHYKYIEIYTDREQHNFKDIVFRPEIYDNDFDCLWTGNRFFTYEEAVEAALKYTLENLI